MQACAICRWGLQKATTIAICFLPLLLAARHSQKNEGDAVNGVYMQVSHQRFSILV